MSLDVRARFTRPGGRHQGAAFALDVAFAVRSGETLAVLGPNGAGKSTLLSLVAGLLVPDAGTITVGGEVVTGPHRFVPPHRRRVGLMGQDPLLFPHLSARDNIAFGPRAQGRERRSAEAGAAAWLDRLGLAELGGRRPAQLSGGQRQRVALARALAAEPAVLLLDEPLGALDLATAPAVRHELRTHLRDTGVTAVLVTHDLLDAAVLADRILLLDGGRIVDDGPVAQVLQAPRTPFAAALAGLNLVPGTASAAVAPGGEVRLLAADGSRWVGLAAAPVAAGDPVGAVFEPSAVSVRLSGPSDADDPAPDGPGVHGTRNRWDTTVVSLEPGDRGGATVRLRTGPDRPAAVDLTATAAADLGLVPGRPVRLGVKALQVRVHPIRSDRGT